MKRRISEAEAREQFDKLLQRAQDGDENVVERDGEIVGVLISPSQYEIIERQRRELAALMDEVAAYNAGDSPEEIEAEIAAAIREEREEARRQAS